MPRDRQKDLLDLEVIAELFEFFTVKLCPIFEYDGVRDSVPVDDVLVNKRLDLYRCDGHECFYFNPFIEVVDSHYCVLHTTSSFGKSAN